ncbi:recQ-mediated genome instability protein 1 isoform X2 [Nilaparvata lugens]|nr:recQ-mediated genome instability protein 1 isoform X2 [Nilaparvata lugens]XP_039281837.1 recQ-mediated genome instability protein 1 isoform X2 [Nilaparvata lugens]XP_039281840.1 recQ-mediated genome instability protein 1 isoform X2 [Nilaparvata lugens]
MTNESEVVSRFLSTKNIHLPSSNDWLDGCIEWFKSQQENYSTSELQNFALQQWLLADLRMISHGSLPPNLSDINSIMLTGTYPMQINYFFNVGESAYSQYEKMRKLCLDDQQIGAETQASWMPKPKRMLKMEITDGVQTIQGFEYSYLTKLNESMEPGLKVLVKGPVECRKGVLLLKDNNIEILGGELDTLVESNPVAHIIAEKLQFDPNVVKNNITQTDNTTQLFSQVNVGNENRAPNVSITNDINNSSFCAQ